MVRQNLNMTEIPRADDSVTRLVLITLDSCRWDSAQSATTPFLDSLGPLRLATAHGTFTLPAHVALFHGYFPAVIGATDTVLSRLPQYKRWGKTGQSARGTVEGQNLVDGLKQDGWTTVGAAGMRWFKSANLQQGFGKFFYWGPEYLPSDGDLPSWSSEDYALAHVEELVDAVGAAERWLLFINAAETHAPYACTAAQLEEQRRLKRFRNAKEKLPNDDGTARLMSQLRQAQIEAVSNVDDRLRTLFEALPRPFHYVITADHGESFGEEGIWGHVHGAQEVLHVPLWEGLYE